MACFLVDRLWRERSAHLGGGVMTKSLGVVVPVRRRCHQPLKHMAAVIAVDPPWIGACAQWLDIGSRPNCGRDQLRLHFFV
ncbi:hypothetical protein [Lacticaseibacillus absianus]|uniref:hypothetical protein n=1 Tax=Lacticaseibacillus absianus TaxID=2729623 RepID=UPI0015C9D367|nr:hypothetical protein [Lacticaseibacillus absianus]